MSEEDAKKLLKKHLPEFVQKLDPASILPYLPCLTTNSREKIQCCQANNGRSFAMQELHSHLIRSDDWYRQFIAALRHTEINQQQLADLISLPTKPIATGPVTPTSAEESGRVITLTSAEESGRVITPTSAEESGRVITPTSAEESGRVITPTSAEESGRVITPTSAEESGRVITPTSAEESGRVLEQNDVDAVLPYLRVSSENSKRVKDTDDTPYKDLAPCIEQLLKVLDGGSTESSSWRELAKALGYSAEEMNQLQIRGSHTPSHIVVLLNDWKTRPNTTLQKLKKALSEIDREDVIKEISKIADYLHQEILLTVNAQDSCSGDCTVRPPTDKIENVSVSQFTTEENDKVKDQKNMQTVFLDTENQTMSDLKHQQLSCRAGPTDPYQNDSCENVKTASRTQPGDSNITDIEKMNLHHENEAASGNVESTGEESKPIHDIPIDVHRQGNIHAQQRDANGGIANFWNKRSFILTALKFVKLINDWQ